MTDSELTFTFDEVPYRVDIASLTVDEWIELEEQGVEFSVGKAMTMKVLKGVAWAAVHRDRPEVSFADIGRVAMLKLLEGSAPGEEPVEELNPTSPASVSETAGD